MKNYTHMSGHCYCLPSCNSIKFSFNEKQLPINTDEECSSGTTGYLQTIGKLNTYPTFINALNILSNNNTGKLFDWKSQIKIPSYQKMCEMIYKNDISMVEILMEGQTYTRMKQSLKVTLAEKIGTVGGQLGLFCGFSVIVIFELAYWILSLLSSFFNIIKN